MARRRWNKRGSTSNFWARLTGFLGWSRAWGPVLTVVASTLFLWVVSGSFPAAVVIVAALLAVAFFAYWRVRLARTDVELSPVTVAEQLWRVWWLLHEWPRICRQARLGKDWRGVTPRLGKVRVADDGTISSVVRNGRYGVLTPQLVDKAPDLADLLGCYDVEVTDLRSRSSGPGRWAAFSRRSGMCQVRFFFDDALARVMRLAELPIAPTGEASIGRTIGRTAMTIKLHLNLLIFGQPGYGKSNAVWTLLASLVRDGVPVRLYVSDPKGGTELRELGDQVGAGNGLFEVRRYATTTAETLDMLRSLEGAMDKRLRTMRDRGLRKHVPSVDDPLVIFLCDEFLDLSAELKKGSDSPLGRLLYKGRAAGYVTWGLSQVPTADTLGPLRKMFQQRVAFRLDSATSCRPALSVDAPAHLLDRPGVGYLHREGMAAPVKFRSPLVTDAETGMIARGQVPYMPGDEVVDPHVVYRFWGVVPGQEDDGEQLLYIGHSNDFERRDAEHQDRSPWRAFATRWDASEEWPNKARALAAETRAIEEERPLFNKQGNGRNPLRVAASWGRAA